MIYTEHPNQAANTLLRSAEIAIHSGRPATLTASTLARSGRFLLIGTVQSQAVHVPRPAHQHYDTELKAWVLDAEPSQKSALYATDVGGIAVLSALFGDLNEVDQRKRLGVPLTDLERPHFGWEPSDPDWDSRLFKYYALPELISAVRKQGYALEASIDVIERPVRGYNFSLYPFSLPEDHENVLPPERQDQPYTQLPSGIHHGTTDIQGEAITYMSIPVNGTDLPPNILPLILRD